MRTLLILALAMQFLSCSDDPVTVVYTETEIIAHRGSGSVLSGLGLTEENTLYACQKGFSLTDGVEIDIQRSKDHVLYLFHNKIIESCQEQLSISLLWNR